MIEANAVKYGGASMGDYFRSSSCCFLEDQEPRWQNILWTDSDEIAVSDA